jgi:Iap family predicted aminopeptidase
MEISNHALSSSLIIKKAMRSLCVLLLFAQFSCSTPGQDVQFDGQSALLFVEQQMAFGPRIPGSEASRKTAVWVVEQLEAIGWETEIQHFSYHGTPLMNIIAKSEGDSEIKPILIGAHYDTANDGASGVAVLIELAHALDWNRLRQPVWLVFFDAEDSGNIDGWDWIVGSSFFADNLTQNLEAAVIVDMVGDRDLQLFIEKNSDPDLVQEIWELADQLGYPAFINTPKYSMIDDHSPFLRIGVPAIDIIDFDYPHWHTINDTIDKVSADSLEQVGRTLEYWLENQR